MWQFVPWSRQRRQVTISLCGIVDHHEAITVSLLSECEMHLSPAAMSLSSWGLKNSRWIHLIIVLWSYKVRNKASKLSMDGHTVDHRGTFILLNRLDWKSAASAVPQVENYLQLCSNHFQMKTSRYLLAMPQSKRCRRSTCEFAHICIQLCKAKLYWKHILLPVGCCLVGHKMTIFWKVIVTCRIHIGNDQVESSVD
jgi:hypothetical protein